MQDKNKQQPSRDQRPDTSSNVRDKNEDRRDNNTGAVSAGNLVNSGRSKDTTTTHTKSGVTGSDSDGQAD